MEDLVRIFKSPDGDVYHITLSEDKSVLSPDARDALKDIKFKKAEINGHEVYEVTYPNGNRAVVSSPEQAIATCQMAMQMEFLAKSLPDYMVPAAYIQLDELPLTPNGKVDRKRLPAPDIAEEDTVPPATPLEQQLFDLAAERLGTDRFGVTSNLISIGLTSIAAMRLSISIHQKTGFSLSVRDILSEPTIRQMAKVISEGQPAGQVNLADYHVLQEYYPLTENQRGVYIDWEMNRDTTQYNIPHVFRFRDMDAEKLAEALRKVVDAHSYIKTRFVIHDGEVMQQRWDEEPAQVSLRYLEQEPDIDFFQSRVRPFNPFEDDLYRLEVYAFRNEVWLFKDFHHLVSDGLSEEVFYHDLLTAYRGGSVEKEELSAFDFALYEQELKKSERYRTLHIQMTQTGNPIPLLWR